MSDKEKMLLGPPDESGTREVIWKSGNETVHGTLEDLRDGMTLTDGAKLMQVDERPGADGWHEAKTLYTHSSGPAQVATPAYRAGYDRIFGKKEVGLA